VHEERKREVLVRLQVFNAMNMKIASIIRVTKIGELGTTFEEWRLLGCYAMWLL
jgi:hypothetical protein